MAALRRMEPPSYGEWQHDAQFGYGGYGSQTLPSQGGAPPAAAARAKGKLIPTSRDNAPPPLPPPAAPPPKQGQPKSCGGGGTPKMNGSSPGWWPECTCSNRDWYEQVGAAAALVRWGGAVGGGRWSPVPPGQQLSTRPLQSLRLSCRSQRWTPGPFPGFFGGEGSLVQSPPPAPPDAQKMDGAVSASTSAPKMEAAALSPPCLSAARCQLPSPPPGWLWLGRQCLPVGLSILSTGPSAPPRCLTPHPAWTAASQSSWGLAERAGLGLLLPSLPAVRWPSQDGKGGGAGGRARTVRRKGALP